MGTEFEIYFYDLTEDAQERLLKEAGLKNESEANWDVFPVAFVPLDE